MKYIIFDMVHGVSDFLMIFPEIVDHHAVGYAFGGEKNILSAGYVAIANDCHGVTVECHRDSMTYPDKPVREEDSEIILRAIKKY